MINENLKKIGAKFLNFCLVLVFCSLVSCSGGGGGSGDTDTGNPDSTTTFSAKSFASSAVYAGTLSSTSAATDAISSAVLTSASACKGGSGTLNITFTQAANSSSGTSSGTLSLGVNETTCNISLVSVTLGSGATYTSTSDFSITSSGVFTTTPGQFTTTSSSATTSTIYLNFKVTAPSPGIAPSVLIIYGNNSSSVAAVANSAYFGIGLSSGTSSASQTSAPEYCLGSALGVCDSSSSVTNLGVLFDANYKLEKSYFNLYPTLSSSQLGEAYAMFSINNGAPLVTSGTFNSTITTPTSVSVPANSVCGNINALSTMSGCTFAVADALWNSTAGVTKTVSGAVATSTTYTQTIGSNVSQTGTSTVTSVVGGSFLAIGITADYYANAATMNVNADPFGIGFNGATAPSHTAQTAVRYLIIRHLDSSSNTPAYQMFILNVGY